MRKESTAYFRISFRKSDFYLGELFPHLASLKDEREKSLEIKKIIFSRSKLDNHNKFQQEESKLPKLITFRLHISERELWLDPIRKIILATPRKLCITQHHLCFPYPFFHLVNFPSLRAQVFAHRQAFEALFSACTQFLGALMPSSPTALAATNAAPSTNCPAQTRCAAAACSSSDPGNAL